ncbi:MAG TPA: hypothetical protein VL651_03480 [Bacteroidia bacterium]|jgi:hypothetical protein|nr:hypothetical protein [Bacteroidia bacterium]
MKKILIPATLFALLCSCKHEVKETTAVKPRPKPSLVIGNPLDCGIENTLIFPVGSDYQPSVTEAPVERNASDFVNGCATMCLTANTSENFYDANACRGTEYVNNNENEFDIRNILFYDKVKGTTYQLMSDTFHILSFAIHKEFVNPMILYRVVKQDVNNDSIYNKNDAVILYTSDLFGKHLIQVTPDDQQFVDYYYYPETASILTKTLINANKDTAFDLADETDFREMKLKEPAMGREIFTKSLKDSLRLQGKTY